VTDVANEPRCRLLYLLLESLLEDADPRRLRSRSLRDELLAALPSFSLVSFSLLSFSFSPSPAGLWARALFSCREKRNVSTAQGVKWPQVLTFSYCLIS